MSIPLPLILHLAQDDPRKCSARKLARFNKAVTFDRMDKIPFGSVLLDPFSDKAFSPMDRGIIMTKGLLAVDCSWRDAERIFNTIRTHRRTEERALPMLLAANPTKFGRWGELSTLEALAASYYIIGEKHMAEDMLSIYTWGIRFLETNKEPLEAYSKCRDSSEVVEVQKEFV